MIQGADLMQALAGTSRFRLNLGAALAMAVTAFAPGAWADPSPAEINAAKAAFQAGLALEAAGDYAQALGRFREVTAVKATPQALFHIARCLEQLGKWTEAVGTYRLAIEKASSPAESAVRQQADAARMALEPRLPRVVIERGRGAEAAAISLDGVALGSTTLGSPMPADPGPHVVTATAAGKPPFQMQVTVREFETRNIRVDLDSAPVAAPAPERPAPEPQGSKLFSRTTGYYVAGAGLASLVASTVFLVLRQNAISDLEDQCFGLSCPQSSEDTYDRAKTYTVLGNVFLGVGLVGTGLGTYMVIKGPRDQPQQPRAGRVWIAPVGPASMGASVGGTF